MNGRVVRAGSRRLLPLFRQQIRMRQFLATLPGNFTGCFQGWKLAWHVVAVMNRRAHRHIDQCFQPTSAKLSTSQHTLGFPETSRRKLQKHRRELGANRPPSASWRARKTVPNFVPFLHRNRYRSETLQRFVEKTRKSCPTSVSVLSSDTKRSLGFVGFSAWGACGRRFKSGRPDQSEFLNKSSILAVF